MFNLKKRNIYFIADIASNHDGDLNKAKELIHMAAESGANAAKFQNFYAETLISELGFKKLKKIKSHQTNWNGSVYDIYKKNEISLEWTETLLVTCKKHNIDFFTTPYDKDIISYLNKFVSAWKIGSGDITWHENIIKIAKTQKPIIIATGASTIDEVKSIYEKVLKINKKICIMQCNTNYTGRSDNFKFINLNVLKSYKKLFPKAVLGLSDHTHGHETVLGAVALGAKIIEKHFTDSNKNIGPDHLFSMNPKNWKKMVDATKNLVMALGDEIKKIEKNEKVTSILQRRSIRLKRSIKKGEIIIKEDLEYLRPCPRDAMHPYQNIKIIGKKSKKNYKKSSYIKIF